jgi:molybdopterin/thiamine biosynthesis adenylyltransferase
MGAGENVAWIEWYDWPRDVSVEQRDSAGAVRLKGVPESGSSLQGYTVMVIGLGAVGAIALCELARAGVGTLIGIDVDRYGPESWLTQPIRRGVDRGRSKARLQGARAHAINPAVHVMTAKGLAQHVPLWAYRRADVILVAGDNLEVVVFAGTRAAALGKGLIQGSVFGESWLALVRSFDLTDANRVCPACGLSQREWAMLRSRVGCDPNSLREQGIEPTRSMTCICGTAAHLLVGEALKCLFQVGQPLSGEELAYCLLSHKARRTSYGPRNPTCPCPHARWQVVDIPASPDAITLAALLDHAPAGQTQVQGELPWVSFTVCPGCGSSRVPIRRFGRPGETFGTCRCGEALVASPLGVRSFVPAEDLRHCADLPLSQLGLEPGSAVVTSGDDQWTCLFVGDPASPAAAHNPEEEPSHA